MRVAQPGFGHSIPAASSSVHACALPSAVRTVWVMQPTHSVWKHAPAVNVLALVQDSGQTAHARVRGVPRVPTTVDGLRQPKHTSPNFSRKRSEQPEHRNLSYGTAEHTERVQ